MKRIFHVTVFSLAFVSFLKAQTITTIAGTGVEGYNGDNKAATIAQLKRPAGVVCDNAGNIFIADFLNNRVRKIDLNGMITTTAGVGNAGYSGDNSSAVNAQINGPEAPYFDQSGNFYFSDAYNHRIRKINLSGTINTVAGTGVLGYNGDNITATTAQLNYPSNGLVVDGSGNIFIADSYNNRVRKIDASSGMITTVAGTGVAGYNGDNISAVSAQLNVPYGLTLDGAGNLYIVDASNQRVRKVDNAGVITTIAGTGIAGYNGDNRTATSANLNEPRSVLVDAAGNIFIADAVNNRIRKINTNGIISTICGDGSTSYNGDNIPANFATINYPNGLAFDLNGNLIIAELGSSRIRKITNAAIILPLSITKFTAHLQNKAGLLQWQTKDEVNVRQFIIEVSYDNRNFSSLDSVNAKNLLGENNYFYLDNRIKIGVNYYRLRIIDKDGKTSYTNITTLRLENEMLSISLAPNPTKGFANLSFSSDVVANYVLSIVDMQGKIIRQLKGKASTGPNSLTLDVDQLAKGSYLLKINIADKIAAQTKFVKE